MTVTPKVSVLMPVYNAEKYLDEAVGSVLKQTLTDFEIVVIDDGSIDHSIAILEEYRDPRIRIFRNEKNIGVARTVNRGLELCQGEYIARMDADDISLPDRLARQCQFLVENPQISMVGTDILRIDNFGNPLVEQFKNPHSWGAIKWHLLINNCLAHPTIMTRRDFFRTAGIYEMTTAEDYGLWLRAAEKGLKFANLPEVLVKYRVHGGSVSAIKNNALLLSSAELLQQYARTRVGFELDIGLAIDCMKLADTRLPLQTLLRIGRYYGALTKGSFMDPECSIGDAFFILRRVVSRIGKGFIKNFSVRGTAI